MKLMVFFAALFAAVVGRAQGDERIAPEGPTLATVTVVFEDGRGNSWTNRQVMPISPKMLYSTNDVAYIGTVTEIRPDAVTEWQAMLQKVEVLWGEYSRRQELRNRRRQRAAEKVSEPSVRKRVNELNEILKKRYKEKKR